MKAPAALFLILSLLSFVLPSVRVLAEEPLSDEAIFPAVRTSPTGLIAGFQAGWGQCPCFRWVVQFQGLGGSFETREWLVSSEALFRMRENVVLDMGRWTNRTFTMGPIEALWKGGHVGLGFRGVSVGKELDRGYTSILRSGIYVLANLLRTDLLRLDVRSGYALEHMRVNDAEETTERHALDESLELDWDTGRWNGRATAYVHVNNGHGLDFFEPRAGGTLGVRVAAVQWRGMEIGFSLDALFEHDPLFEAFGMHPDNLTATLLMDVSYEAGPFDLSRRRR